MWWQKKRFNMRSWSIGFEHRRSQKPALLIDLDDSDVSHRIFNISVIITASLEFYCLFFFAWCSRMWILATNCVWASWPLTIRFRMNISYVSQSVWNCETAKLGRFCQIGRVIPSERRSLLLWCDFLPTHLHRICSSKERDSIRTWSRACAFTYKYVCKRP